MSAANFNPRSWASNNDKLKEQVNKDGTGTESGAVNVLGLQWDTTNNTISLTEKPHSNLSNTGDQKRSIA